ncbi:Ger(x)C family spore germination protein [Bacillus sp. Marseille-P3661]|uniref:Ger(x)C family spore germination protein n=1 Tax=Bacillus sp. Marseille-P3661 TaxID=1936234 RepID=UPI000C82A9A9|nr:Ger(x)C family spore germination protein [Bacillus sp. Marseille-P3661]
MKKAIIVILLLSCSIVSGLFTNERIVDDIYIVMIVGYDYVNEHLFTGTAVAPQYKADNTIENMAYSDTSSLVYENRDKLEAKSQNPLISGKLEVALFNKELAEKKGLLPYVDNLLRDPNIGSRVYLAIFDGSTEKVLHKQFKDQPTGVYFSDLLEQNIEYDNLPFTNLHTFSFQYFAEGADPILPLLNEEKEKVNISGIALFNKDKMVDSIEKSDFIYFRSMYNNFKNGALLVQLDNNDRAFITSIKSHRKFKITNNTLTPNPSITINIKMKGTLREFDGPETSPSLIKEIEKQIEKEVKTKTSNMIKDFQAKGIDPVGIGEQFRNYDRNWDKSKWEDLYPNVKVTINVDFTILEHGVVK